MSWQAIKHVIEHPAAADHDPYQRAVALIVAWHANEYGAESYPSTSTISAESKVSVRKVGPTLRALEASGLIECYRRMPSGGTRVWRFPLLGSGPDPETGKRPAW